METFVDFCGGFMGIYGIIVLLLLLGLPFMA